MFTQVVGSVFELMETHEKAWTNSRDSAPVPSFGFHYHAGVDPVRVSVDHMLDNFQLGCSELAPVWQVFLARDLQQNLKELGHAGKVGFHFSDDLWVRSVNDFALAYHRRSLPSEQLLRSMIPLYLGRTASFVLEAAEASAEEVEARIEQLRMRYEQHKGHLLASWNHNSQDRE